MKRKLSLLTLIVPMAIMTFLSSCEKEDKSDEELDKNRGIFTARVDGEFWAADEIYYGLANAGKSIQISATNNANSSSISIHVPNPIEKVYGVDDAVLGYHDKQGDNEVVYGWMEGSLNLSRFTADSLFASGEFLGVSGESDSVRITDIDIAISTETWN